MDDGWLKTVMGLMAQIVITVYSKEEDNFPDTLVNLAVTEEKMIES